MIKSHLFLHRPWRINGLAVVLALLFPALGQAQLEWRISVKMILDSQGNRASSGSFITDLQVTNAIKVANAILDAMGRGYRYRLTEIANVSGVSQWFNVDITTLANKRMLEQAAEADPATYLYRQNAINLYINGAPDTTGICSFPDGASNDNDIICMGQGAFPTTICHEGGHYFTLCHTFQGEQFRNMDNSICMAADCTCPIWVGGNSDQIGDTITDHQCWTTQNQIAQATYNVDYGSVGSDDAAVDRVYLNVMSYRVGVRTLFTPDQLDRMTDVSNGNTSLGNRFKVATGRTRFVSTTGNDSSGNGRSTSPYRTMLKGVTVADVGDIVLLRGGNYNEPQTINKHVTLRAARGSATIGRP